MIDFGKLYCDLHPNEIITNFCLKETCMVGLCATCICTHTQYHVNNKTSPEYQNIRTTFSTMHQTIRKKMTSLDNQKNRIEKITQFIQTKRKALKENVEQTRTQAIAVVNNFFDSKEKNMLRQLEGEEKKMGLHSEGRMESLMNSLSRQTSLLITSAQELNSLNFLESYQRIKTQTLFNAKKLEEQIAKELDRNEDFETIINTNDEYIQNLMKVLEQSLQLTFKMNYRACGLKTQQNVFSNESAMICPQKINPRFTTLIQQKSSQPVFIQRPSTAVDSNVFSALSFNNMPEMFKQQTAKFNHHDEAERQTTKSIQFSETQNTSLVPSGRQNKSFINELNQSQIQKQFPVHNQIFRQKDINERQLHQSLNKSASFGSRNHQSQMIIVEKPFGYQSNANWNNARTNNHNQSMNQSLIENIQHVNQEKSNKNTVSQLNLRNQSPVNLHQLTRQVQPNVQGGHKFNFVPHIFDANQFNNKGNQNQMLLNDSKKMKKSGLTLLKVNSTSPSLRMKIQGE